MSEEDLAGWNVSNLNAYCIGKMNKKQICEFKFPLINLEKSQKKNRVKIKQITQIKLSLWRVVLSNLLNCSDYENTGYGKLEPSLDGDGNI